LFEERDLGDFPRVEGVFEDFILRFLVKPSPY